MHFVDAKGILTGGQGRYGMNIYRGRTHGSVYCDSRSRCCRFTYMSRLPEKYRQLSFLPES